MSRHDASAAADVLDEWTIVEDMEVSATATATATATAIAAEEEVEPERQEEPIASKESEPRSEEQTLPDGCLHIRIRIGEELRPAHFQAQQRVDEFQAQFFADALQQGKRVRLIYMGMLLLPDRPMVEYGIEEDAVIHAVITDCAAPTPPPEIMEDVPLKGYATPANTLLVSTGLVLYGLWTVQYYYPHLFSWKATILLGTLSVAHVSATVSRIVG